VWAGHVNARLDQVGLSSALRWAAAAGGHWQLMHEASATYRVVGGMSGFTAAIAADVRARSGWAPPWRGSRRRRTARS
jgi:hypothetical protein